MEAMDDTDREQLRRWVQCWRAAGPRLAELRQRELEAADTQQAMLNLADAFESYRLHFRPAPTSGLIEQQALFQRLRR
jgi:hypothetical protein